MACIRWRTEGREGMNRGGKGEIPSELDRGASWDHEDAQAYKKNILRKWKEEKDGIVKRNRSDDNIYGSWRQYPTLREKGTDQNPERFWRLIVGSLFMRDFRNTTSPRTKEKKERAQEWKEGKGRERRLERERRVEEGIKESPPTTTNSMGDTINL